MPTFGVATIVSGKGGVLLVKREDLEVWTVPGGAVEDGESLAEAAVRETREETGIEARLIRLVGTYSKPKMGRHLVVFAGEAVGGELAAQPGEALDVGFFPPDALPEPLLWWFQRAIADALNGRSGEVWTQDAEWPFDFPPDDYQRFRAELARSGLSRPDFYRRYLSDVGPGGERRELPA